MSSGTRRAEVDHFDGRAVGGEFFSGVQGVVDHRAVRDDRDVASFALAVGAAERQREVGERYWELSTPEEQLHRLDEQARVVVVETRVQQADGIGRGARPHDLDARHMHRECFEGLGVLRSAAGAHGGADHHRCVLTSARQVANLRCVVGDLVERDTEEVHEHELRDRAHARERGAQRRADDRRLGDRRVAHTIGAVLGGQPERDLEHAAGRIGDVFAEQDDPIVAGERAVEGPVDRLHEADRFGVTVGECNRLGAWRS